MSQQKALQFFDLFGIQQKLRLVRPRTLPCIFFHFASLVIDNDASAAYPIDTVDANLRLGLPADLRDYGIGAQILVDLGLSSIRILTNNPKKISGLAGYGLSVSDQVPIQHMPNPHNEAYLRTKRDKLGHTLHHQGLALDEQMIRDEHKHDRRRQREG